MFKIIAKVYGVYTHGRMQGKTNPKSVVTVTVHGETAKDALKNLTKTADGAFYRVVSFLENGVAIERGPKKVKVVTTQAIAA